MNEAKLERVYSRYSNNMFYIAYRILQDVGHAEDAVQMATEKISRYLDVIDEKDDCKTRKFVMLVAKSEALNIYRALKRERDNYEYYDALRETDAPDSASSAEQVILERERQSEIIEKIQSLPKRYSEVLMMRYVYGMSYEEMVKALDVSYAAARKRIERAKAHLKKELERMWGEQEK